MSKLILSGEDRRIATEWRRGELQVLCDVNPKEYREPTGKVILVPCADGHQMFDICEYQKSLTVEGHIPMVHPLSLNGGPLLLAAGSPLLSEGDKDDEVLLKHIAQAYSIKGTPTIILYSHAPCGAARVHNLSIVDVVELMLAAKDRLKALFDNLQVIPKLHVDWATGESQMKKNSYFVSREQFVAWRKVAA